MREGRTFRSAVPRGWARAKRTILSADAVSFLSAFILYVLAVGEVKGFAFTLGLSTVLDLVVVFLVTHPLVHLAAGSHVFTSPTWSGLGGWPRPGRSSERPPPGSAPRRSRYDDADEDTVRRPQRSARAATALGQAYGRQAGFLSRLSTGTGAFNILGRRKIYYIVSGRAGGRLDPADRVPRLPLRDRFRRRHHPDRSSRPTGSRVSTTEVAAGRSPRRPGSRPDVGADGRQPDPGHLADR